MYTFHDFCKVVIRNAVITAWRDQQRRHKREISLEYLTEEKFYPLGTTDEYFTAPYEVTFNDAEEKTIEEAIQLAEKNRARQPKSHLHKDSFRNWV